MARRPEGAALCARGAVLLLLLTLDGLPVGEAFAGAKPLPLQLPHSRAPPRGLVPRRPALAHRGSWGGARHPAVRMQEGGVEGTETLVANAGEYEGWGKVPSTMGDAAAIFFKHPSPRIVMVGEALLLSWRASMGPISPVDAAAAAGVAVLWLFQEWALHKYLLHASFDWVGTRIHKGHHATPYFHVCIDSVPLVMAWLLIATVVFLGLLPIPQPLGLTCLIAYMAMGLTYEWSHYLAHTRVVPQFWLWRESKRCHTKHHLADEDRWLAFTLPWIDDVMGTGRKR